MAEPAETPDVVTTPAVTPTVTPEVTPTPETKHPLEPGGIRFEEVYARMKQAEAREQETRERLARLEGESAARATQPPAPPPQQKLWSAAELQTEVDAGRITPAIMAEQLAWQHRQLAKVEMRQEFTQERVLGDALTRVDAYITARPTLRDTASADFQTVRAEVARQSQRLGLPITDPRVQEIALAITLGPIDKLAKAAETREFQRTHGDLHVESGGGGGASTPSKDPLADMPAAQVAFWDRMHYTKEQRLAEAPYVRARVAKRAARAASA